MLKTFMQKRTIPSDQILKKTKYVNFQTSPAQSTQLENFPTTPTHPNINMNMLLNGKSLH